MHHNLELFTQQWDGLAGQAQEKGYAHLDALNWFNYLAFDIIGKKPSGRDGPLEAERLTRDLDRRPGFWRTLRHDREGQRLC